MVVEMPKALDSPKKMRLIQEFYKYRIFFRFCKNGDALSNTEPFLVRTIIKALCPLLQSLVRSASLD